MDPAQFAAPLGYFVVGYLDGVPVAVRRLARARRPGPLRPDAEIKRMYVGRLRARARARRQVLAQLERTARRRGRTRIVLETGLAQPEAIALYASSGYERIPNFGVYRDHPESLCFGKALRFGRMAIYALGDYAPEIHPEAYVHPDATVIGDVRIARVRVGVAAGRAARRLRAHRDRRAHERPGRHASCTAPSCTRR